MKKPPNELTLTPLRPFLFKAMLDWMLDNNLTPLMEVDATLPNVRVPTEYVTDSKIMLNIAPHATHHFISDVEAVSFSARFNGASRDLYIPMYAILGIYAKETRHGTPFDPAEYTEALKQLAADSAQSAPATAVTNSKKRKTDTAETDPEKAPENEPEPPKARPKLRIIDN